MAKSGNSESDLARLDHLQDALNVALAAGEVKDQTTESSLAPAEAITGGGFDNARKPPAPMATATGMAVIVAGDHNEQSESTPRVAKRKLPDSPNLRRSRRRGGEKRGPSNNDVDDDDEEEEDETETKKTSFLSPMDEDGGVTSSPRSVPKITCMVDGCEKLRCKQGFCQRHYKDPSAPLRTGSSEYKPRYCVIAGCQRLRAKGGYCFRHSKDPDAPLRNKSEGYDRKKPCIVDGCDRQQVKAGFCSRHFKDKEAPVLKTPAFSFDADARWDELFPQLQEFFKKEGHSRYPTTSRSDLGKFVTHIRSVYRAKKVRAVKNDPDADPTTLDPDLSSSKLLTPERMQALAGVNFEFQLWSLDQSQWETRFLELLAYREKHGHFHVTSRENATLSSWSKTQRQRYKNTMALYQGLYGVEFISSQKKAEELYELAKQRADKAREDGEEIPTLADVGEAKNTLDPEKIAKLTAVGFEWDLQKDTYVESWEARYLQLMKFKVTHGHCRVPKNSGDNPQLGQWVKQMRKYYNWKEEGKPCPATFTQERIDRLNELGFEWRLKDTPATNFKSETSEAQDAVAVARGNHHDSGLTMETHSPTSRNGAGGPGGNKSGVRLEDLLDGSRYEPFRANVTMYEQRGWI